MISKFWNGDYPLVKMYWVYGILLPLAVAICFFGVLLAIGRGGYSSSTSLYVGIAVLAIAILSFIYGILWSVGTWRSASKYTGPRIWAILAKIMVVIGFLSCLGNFFEKMAPLYR